MAPPSLMRSCGASAAATTTARAVPISLGASIGLRRPVARAAAAAAARSPAARSPAAAAARPLPTPLRAVQQPPSPSPPDLEVEGASRDYCNDFECTSSPAVESAVRQLARDIGARRWTARLFQPDVKYSDGVRRFSGGGLHGARTFWPEFALRGAKATVTRIRMVDKGTAEISWTVKGDLPIFSGVSADVVTTFALNLLTGRVTEHTEAWQASPGTGAPAAAALAASRAAWAAREASLDAGEGLGRAADTLSSMASMEDDSAANAGDPNDPMKFFQGQTDEQAFNSDALALATGLAVLWLVYKGFEATATL